jgi:hypothetical protein
VTSTLREDVGILNRATAFRKGDPTKTRAFLEAEEPGQRNVGATCELLEVSKAAYYQSLKAEPCDRARTEQKALDLVERHFSPSADMGTRWP